MICIKSEKVDQIDLIAELQKNFEPSVTFHPDIRSKR